MEEVYVFSACGKLFSAVFNHSGTKANGMRANSIFQVNKNICYSWISEKGLLFVPAFLNSGDSFHLGRCIQLYFQPL